MDCGWGFNTCHPPLITFLLKLDKKIITNYRIPSNMAPGGFIFQRVRRGGLIRGRGVLLEGVLFSGPTNWEGALFLKAIIMTCKVKMIRTFCLYVVQCAVINDMMIWYKCMAQNFFKC